MFIIHLLKKYATKSLPHCDANANTTKYTRPYANTYVISTIEMVCSHDIKRTTESQAFVSQLYINNNRNCALNSCILLGVPQNAIVCSWLLMSANHNPKKYIDLCALKCGKSRSSPHAVNASDR